MNHVAQSDLTGTLQLSDIPSEHILDSLPDGVYVTDTDRRILFWNREAERVTGWMRSEVVGHRCHENILCHKDKDGHLLCGHEHCPLHRAMVTGTQSDVPRLIFAKTKDGTRIPVEVTVAPIWSSEGKVAGGIEVFRDLSPAFQDLNHARLIQREMMELNIPEDERLSISVRYTPHDQVGGDFYRADRLPDGRYALLIADVVGHGVSAALYTMQLRILWDEGRSEWGDPREFLNWLSNRLTPLTDIDTGYYGTAVHAVYDPVSGAYDIACAGHPAPALLRATGQIERLQSQGPGLGLLENPHFTSAQGFLRPGEHLILFTDGAYEIENAEGAEMGEEMLMSLIRDAFLGQHATPLATIEELILQYSNALSLPDDLTLIDIMRRS